MPEMNNKLGKFAKQEIINAMRGLSGSPAKAEAERLAKIHGVHPSTIYEQTKEVRDSQRKTRSDKGKRAFKLDEGDTWQAFKAIIADKFDAEQALDDAKINGYTNLPTLPTFRRLLRENQVTVKQIRSGRRGYRSFEAEHAGQIYQCDVTGLKEGCWLDKKTRKVLRIPHTQINYNHPNTDANLVKIWQIMLVDDRSRRRFLRYVAKDKLTSDDIVRFLVEAFEELGLCEQLYTDNGPEFNLRCKSAEKLLNIITEGIGGYKHIRHEPNNAQATGKVEGSHKWVEKCDKWIGKMIRIGRGAEITVEMLNNVFAHKICTEYNFNHIHRETGETPMNRWNSSKIVSRIIPRNVLESALLSDVFESKLDEALTIAHKGKVYQIPREVEFQKFIGQKVSAVVPPDIEVILLTLPDGQEYEITKVLAKPDVAGEFKKLAETSGQQLVKKAKLEIKAETKAMKSGELEKAKVKYVDTEVAIVKNNVSPFPQKQLEVLPQDIEKVLPIASSLSTSQREITYWNAFKQYQADFANPSDCQEFLLQLYGSRDAVMLVSEVETAVKNREFIERRKLLKAV